MEQLTKLTPLTSEQRDSLECLLQSKFYFTQSAEIYGGVKGLYDYGPLGTLVVDNIVQLWKRWFITEDNMQHINTSILTPEKVFVASGHCNNFKDKMVKDVETGDCYRADHLLQAKIIELLKDQTLTQEQKDGLVLDLTRADDFSLTEMGSKLKEYQIKSPDTGNELSDPYCFNLMFPTNIGATGKITGFLRPETAQGTFTNFNRLLDFNGGKLPFAVAQIGTVFRNEIAPRSGLLRVREFLQAEIEHFVDPRNKTHKKFSTIANLSLPLLSKQAQMTNNLDVLNVTCKDAVGDKLIDNETLCYYLARTYLFLLNIGIHKDKIRFRQHLDNEMAHYANDCWDAEILCSYSWIECVGHADRGSYDLDVHSNASGKKLNAFVVYDVAKKIKWLEVQLNKAELAKKYKNRTKDVISYFDSIKNDQNELEKINCQLNDRLNDTVTVCDCVLDKSIILMKTKTKVINGENIVPHVIEPSFGIGRIFYCLLEHSYRNTNNESLLLLPHISPYLCVVLPLVDKKELVEQTLRVESILKNSNFRVTVDIGPTSIGRRYARNDQIGIPFGITVDFDGLNCPKNTQSVTVRYRNTNEQLRVLINELVDCMNELVLNVNPVLNVNSVLNRDFSEIKKKYHVDRC